MISHAKKASKEELKATLSSLQKTYYNAVPTVDDTIYDTILGIYESKYGKYKRIGAPPSWRTTVNLPYHMGSLDKVKTKEGLEEWLHDSGPFVITDKVDGMSVVYISPDKLYTRGKGDQGKDVSHLLNYVQGMKRGKCDGHAIRGELVMSREDFQEHYPEEISARSVVGGVVNAKPSSLRVDRAERVTFVAFQILDSEEQPFSQLKVLKSWGFQIPSPLRKKSLSYEYLESKLEERKEDAPYDIDGLVISRDVNEVVKEGNPEHSIAFKGDDEEVCTTVKFVKWRASKHGYMKPRIRIEKVKLDGAVIRWITGFNARFIINNNIGKDTAVSIIRSGKVIPYIKKVIEGTEAQLPEEECRWTENEVDLVVLKPTDEMMVSRVTAFFKLIGVKFLARETIQKMYEAGFKTIPEYFDIPRLKQVVPGISGMGKKSLDRMLKGVEELLEIGIPEERIMHASSIFGPGFGEKKMRIILKEFPDILAREDVYDCVMQVKGFQTKTAEQFAKNVQEYNTFREQLPFEAKEPEEKSSAMEGMTVVFSGFRDKKLEEEIISRGGRVTTSVSKNTTYVVVKTKHSTSSKVTKAQQLDVQVLEYDEFVSEYSLA